MFLLVLLWEAPSRATEFGVMSAVKSKLNLMEHPFNLNADCTARKHLVRLNVLQSIVAFKAALMHITGISSPSVHYHS